MWYHEHQPKSSESRVNSSKADNLWPKHQIHNKCNLCNNHQNLSSFPFTFLLLWQSVYQPNNSCCHTQPQPTLYLPSTRWSNLVAMEWVAISRVLSISKYLLESNEKNIVWSSYTSPILQYIIKLWAHEKFY